MESAVVQEEVSKRAKDLVQIQVDVDEVQNRVSKFIERKRKEVDEANVLEFCNHKLLDEDDPEYDMMDSCARVDAVYIPRYGSNSRIKISRVDNKYGPQTRSNPVHIKTEPLEELPKNNVLEALDERLKPIESHLKISDFVGKNIIQRLKACEDKVLYLESSSPEYFQLSEKNYTSPKKKMEQEVEKAYSSWSIDDLQKRIQVLKENLIAKSKQKAIKTES